MKEHQFFHHHKLMPYTSAYMVSFLFLILSKETRVYSFHILLAREVLGMLGDAASAC